MEIAMEGGFAAKPKNGWYARVNLDTGELEGNKRLADTMNDEFWDPILNDERFKKFVRGVYRFDEPKVELSEEFLSDMAVENEA
jgi:hypothetical protein